MLWRSITGQSWAVRLWLFTGLRRPHGDGGRQGPSLYRRRTSRKPPPKSEPMIAAATANFATRAVRPGRPGAATGEVNALLDDGSICRERRRRRRRFWIDYADGQASRNDPYRKYGAVVVRLPISRGFDGERANGARWPCWLSPGRRKLIFPRQLFLDVSGLCRCSWSMTHSKRLWTTD